MSSRIQRVIDYGERGVVKIVNDGDALAAEAAAILIDMIERTHDKRGAVALSGGSTPKKMSALLARSPYKEKAAESSINFFWGDERWVPLSDPESNAGEALRGFLEPDGVDPARIHAFETEDVTPEESADRYAESLRPWATGGEPFPILDLVFLGMGDDGHTLSLFPHTSAIHETRRWVVANEVPKLKTVRLTMTAPVVNAARDVVFLVGGAGKADRLASVLDGPVNVDAQPSQIIRPKSGGPVWLVDEAAAAKLAKRPEPSRE